MNPEWAKYEELVRLETALEGEQRAAEWIYDKTLNSHPPPDLPSRADARARLVKVTDVLQRIRQRKTAILYAIAGTLHVVEGA